MNVIPFENTFLLVGGYNGTQMTEIVKYTRIGEKWEVLPQTLKAAGYNFFSMMVDTDLFPGCG
jgi:hypothetical protein